MISPALFGGEHASVLLALTIAVAVITTAALVFAAAAIVIRFITDRRAERQTYLWKRWMEPVLDALADPHSMPFRIDIQRRDRLSFLEMLARLSVSLSQEERIHLAALARPHLPAAVDLLDDRDPEFRSLGIQLLGRLGAAEHRDAFVQAIHDSAPLVGLAAIRALARADEEADVEVVLAELPRFEKWGRNLLSTLLASFGERGRAELRRVLADASRPERQRVAAAGALLKLNDIEAGTVAEQVLRSSPDRELGAACLRLVKRLGRPAQAGLLEHLAKSDDPVIRLHAISALSVVGGEDQVDLLTMALSDPSRWVAIRASQGLRDMKRLDRLQELAESDHPRARLAREQLEGGRSHA